MKYHFKRISFLVVALAFGSLLGCNRETREYLTALEAKDRLIERNHTARKDVIDSLGHRNLARADLALAAEDRIEEEVLLVEALLDSHRPHKPDPVVFSQASRLVETLQEQLSTLQDKWVSASKELDPEVANKVSAKIRDVELALSEASETAKKSKPISSARQNSDARSLR